MTSNHKISISVGFLLLIAAGITFMIVPLATVRTAAFVWGSILTACSAPRILQFFPRCNSLVTFGTFVAGMMVACGRPQDLNENIQNGSVGQA